MPYISRRTRAVFESSTCKLVAMIQSPGELNYVLSKIVHEYLRALPASPRYENYNGVMGVLACAQQELYRTVIAPYEDKKARENGAVSALDKAFHDEWKGWSCREPSSTK